MVAERRREIGLQQILSRRQHGTITVEKNRCARMPARNALLRQWQRVGDIVDDVDAVTCECDCRFDQVGKRQFAGTVFFVGEGEAGDGPGHADRQRAVARFFRIGFAAGVQKHRLGCRSRRRFAIIDGDILAGLAEVDHHETAATDVAGARICDRKRKADRDRRIDGIPASIEDFDADARGAAFLRDHDAIAGMN